MSEFGQQLIEETKKVAANNPDFVYKKERGCVYVRNGQPSCLIGHALWNLGLIDASLETCSDNESGVEEIIDALHLNVDGDEQVWLDNAQSSQDIGKSWGQAISLADKSLAFYDDDEEWDGE